MLQCESVYQICLKELNTCLCYDKFVNCFKQEKECYEKYQKNVTNFCINEMLLEKECCEGNLTTELGSNENNPNYDKFNKEIGHFLWY